MNRFFENIPKSLEAGELIGLSGENSRHISAVLRLRSGETITICDGAGTDYICELAETGKTRAAVRVNSIEKNTAEPKTRVVLFQALPKADKMELIIQKCVELGITEIIPFVSEHSVSRPDDKGRAAKFERWEKISEAAAKQSRRGIIPVVHEITGFDGALDTARGLGHVFFADECERAHTLRDELKRIVTGGSVGFFVGPEGGFSEAEREALRQAGISGVSLGSRILRTETAAFAVLVCVNYEMEGLG